MKKVTQITPAELDKLINEEAEKFRKVLLLKKEHDEIKKELAVLNEVKAGDVMDTEGVHAGQKEAVFATKDGNPNLKMEDEEIIDDSDIDAATDVEEDKDAVFKAIEDLKVALENILGKDETEETEDEVEKEEDILNGEGENQEIAADESEKEEGDKVVEFEVKQEEVKTECEMTDAAATEDKKDDTKTDLMESEKKRMARLAGIIKG